MRPRLAPALLCLSFGLAGPAGPAGLAGPAGPAGPVRPAVAAPAPRPVAPALTTPRAPQAAPRTPQAPADQMEALLRAGKEDEALALYKAQTGAPSARLQPPVRARLDALAGRALALRGRLPEAEALLSAAASRDPAALPVRAELALVYQRTGQRDKERALWNRFFDEHDAGSYDMKDPEALRLLGLAARHLGSYRDANDTLRDAADLARERKLPREIVRVNVDWAALLMEKYNTGEAELALKEALAADPDDPDARGLMARVKLDQGNDVAGAEKEIARALAQNPHHPAALAARAEILIDNEEHEEALKVTGAWLQANPADLEARSLQAAAELLLERPGRFEAEKARVLQQNPRYTALHRTVAELLVTQHRYDEAVRLLEEAVRIDPKDSYALSALGSGYLRLGEDDKGLDALRRAWKGDHFNARTFNLLELFEKIIPKKYEIVSVDLPGAPKGLRLRVPQAEKALLLPLLVPMVQREWQALTTRYRFTPRLPLTLELYADPQHYAVRTVGLPNLAALGVTFGQVVTGRSPALGAFNWGLMIWHELSHVFAIQLSRSRVPRWFTEGLSEWETQNERPEWTRRTSAELYAALRDGRLPSLAQLNAGFTRARDVQNIVVAYHEAAAAMDFLIRRFGFAPIVKALQLFAEGKRTGEVLPKVTGLSMEALDQAFRKDLEQRLAAYKGTFYVGPSDYSDVEGLEAQIKQRPGDARLRGLLALALVSGGAREKAGAEIQAALGLDPRCKEALLAQGDLLLRGKDLDGAKRAFEALLAAGGEGYDVRLRLGGIAAQRGDVAAAERELGRAKQLDPDRPEPYAELAKLYGKQKREDDALRELGAAVRLEIMDAELVKTLIKRLHARKRWADIARVADLARHLDPYNADLRAQIGEALLELGRKKEAQAELQAALLGLPSPADEEEAQQLKARQRELEALRRRAER